MVQPAPLLLQVLTAWLACCLCLAPAVRGQTDPYGTVTFAGHGSAQSASAVASLASSYRFVTTAVRNNFAGSSSDLDALTAVGNGSAAYAVIDDLQASDIPSGTLAVPLLGAALVLPYNLNSLGSASVSTLMELVKLDMKTIGLIFAGNITHWNDSQILALNTNATYSYWAGLAASSSDITVVVRADATPTTRAFTRALANASTAFADVVGVSDLPTWPASFVQATGASGVLTAVLNTPGAIGFLDLPSWTSTSGVPYASIRNLNKQNVLPTITNVQRLMADNAKSFKASSSNVANLVDGNNAATWPLGWMNYLVTPTGNFSSCGIPAAVFEWYGWIEYNAQAISAMSTSNYATLHYSVLKRATDALGQIKCNSSRSIPTSVLSGSGATLPLITYQAWIQEYFTNVDPNVALSYTGTGSSTGIADIVNYNTDLGASDAALVASNYAGGGSDLQMLPAIAAAVVMVYNIPDIGQVPIMFTREVLPLIYMGIVTKWNDPLIVSANPSLTLPNASIVIVGRFDGSGTTSVFTQALSLFSPTFNQSVGVQQLVNWGPVNISGMAAAAKGFIPSARYLYGKGNGEVVTLISTTPYSLGYAVSADVLEAGLPFATMKNKAGNNVTANPVTINAALKEFADAFTSNFSAVVQDGASANAWPMATYSYLLIHTRTMTECGKASSLLDFIIWSQTNSKPIAIAEALGYTVTPIAVRRRFLLTLAGVTCNNQTVFSLVPCLQDGVICNDRGTCLDGKCTCQTGFSGDQCQDVAGASSSDNTLAIALGVALPAAFLFLCCLVLLFVAFGVLYWRKGRKQELLLAAEWSDYSTEDMEMSDFSSRSTNSTRSGTGGSSLARDLSFTDLEQLHLSYEPKSLTFGLGPSDKCPVDEEMRDVIVITNHGYSSRKFAFFVPAEDETLRCRLHPGAGVIKSGKSVTVNISCTLLMTTRIERKIKFEVEGMGKHLISIKLVGELSAKLDPNDIVTDPVPIGIGSFGSVYKADYRGQEVAAKILNSQMHAKQIEEFKREVNTLNRLRCPYVLNFIGASHVEGKRCIVTELCQFGSVGDLVFSDKSFNYLLMLKVALDMSKAISFLHGNGVLHRDIKPENFLMVSTSIKSPVTCKIADFGTSRSITTVRELLNHTAALGTPLYMAPEVLEHKPYSAKIDVYSFGIVLWVLYSRREPYTELKRQWDVPRYVIKGKRPAIPHHCPKNFAELITRCWAHSPDDRPDMTDVVKLLENLFEDERGMKNVRQGDVDTARDRELAPDAEGNRDRKGMRTWEGGKNLLMIGKGDSEGSDDDDDDSGSGSGSSKRKSHRKSKRYHKGTN